MQGPAGPADGQRPIDGEPIPEGQRNATLFRMARSLRAKGLTVAGILAALTAENASRCVPPLPTDEVRRIAASGAAVKPGLSAEYAARANVLEPPEWPQGVPEPPPYDGAPHPAEAYCGDAPPPADAPEGESSRLRVCDLSHLHSAELPAPTFIIEPLIPRGHLTLFGGHGGSGKSTVALAGNGRACRLWSVVGWAVGISWPCVTRVIRG